MAAKAIVLVSIQAILFKVALAQYIAGPLGATEIIRNLPLADGCGLPGAVASRVVGANLLIDTSTPSDQSGVSIYSDDLIIEGTVLVEGNLPFEGTVALEGILPATGTSLVSYECGNGNMDIVENLPPAGLAVLPPGGLGWVGLGGTKSLGRL